MPLAQSVLEEEGMGGVSSFVVGQEEHKNKKTRTVFRTLMVGVCIGTVCIVVLISLFGWMKRRRDREKQRERVLRACAGESAGDTIFVSIPSYRDSEAAHTLRSLFARARCPSRVYVGIYIQNAPDDTDPVSEYVSLTGKWNDPFALTDHVRALRVPHRRAAGPYAARYNVHKYLYRGERYVLQIDSHTMFCQDWDRVLIEELHNTQDPRCVLTTIPQIYTFEERHGDATKHAAEPTFPFLNYIDEAHLPHFVARACVGKPNKPFPVISWFPGFSFSRGDLWREVPYTQGVTHLFNGEDIFMAARMWTRGWTFYAPSRMPVFTTFDTSYRATVDSDFARDSVREAHRIASLRHISDACFTMSRGMIGPDHLGSVRPLDTFWKMCGIAPATRRATPAAFAGTTNEASVDEILVKYGSVSDFASVIRGAGGHL